MATEIKGLSSLVGKLKARADSARRDGGLKVVVGYSAPYATFVHEDLAAHHPVGQAKFLEQASRTLGPVMSRTIREEVARGKTMAQALLKAGLILQAASVKLAPVLTGALRASAFTKVVRV